MKEKNSNTHLKTEKSLVDIRPGHKNRPTKATFSTITPLAWKYLRLSHLYSISIAFIVVGLCGCNHTAPSATSVNPTKSSRSTKADIATSSKSIPHTPKDAAIPQNTAEAVFEPFWDQGMSGFKQWKIKLAPKSYAKISQGWCSVTFSWDKAVKGTEIEMERDFNLDCSDYDTMVFSVILAPKTKFEALVDTDKGVKRLLFTKDKKIGHELKLPLGGAKTIKRIVMRIYGSKPGSGWFNWIGLSNSRKLKDWLAYWKNLRKIKWDKYLNKKTEKLKFTSGYNFFISNDKLSKLRKYHAAYLKKFGDSPFTKFAKRMKTATTPEKLIRQFASPEERFLRDRDYAFVKKNGFYRGKIGMLAISGLILKDKKLLRLAARGALSLAVSPEWSAGEMTTMPGSLFDHRSFDESGTVFNIVIALDLAHESFSPAGKEYLLRRIAELGIGNMNYVVWRYPYIFGCNQLAAFSTGRVPGYLALERNWKHVAPYTDLAIKELNSSMEDIFFKDGGYVEGPAYYQYTIGSALPAYYSYAKARKLKFRTILPPALKNAPNYADMFVSTDEHQYFIPVSDCNGLHGIWPRAIAFLASMFPKSQFTRIYNRFLKNRNGERGGDIFEWLLATAIPTVSPAYPSFSIIRSIGATASTRKLKGELVKILLLGDCERGGHKHEDMGSFVLEFAGETFAMDSNSVSYGNPMAALLKHCQRHNTLVPFGTQERARPAYNSKVTLKASGNAEKFNATIDTTNNWKKYFKKRERAIDSPSPDKITITDTYELKRGKGVVFQWLTMLPIKISGKTATITGKRGKIVITAPNDCEISITDLDYYKGTIQHRLEIKRSAKKGTLKVKIALHASGKTSSKLD